MHCLWRGAARSDAAVAGGGARKSGAAKLRKAQLCRWRFAARKSGNQSEDRSSLLFPRSPSHQKHSLEENGGPSDCRCILQPNIIRQVSCRLQRHCNNKKRIWENIAALLGMPATQTTATPPPPATHATATQGTLETPDTPPEFPEDECVPSPRQVRRHKAQQQLTPFEVGLLRAIQDTSAPATQSLSDPVEMFFMSLVPTVKRLSAARQAKLKLEFYKLIYEAETLHE